MPLLVRRRQPLAGRAGRQIAAVLTAHGAPDTVVDEQLRRMRDYRVATTANRSVVGIMNEFSHLADVYRGHQSRPDLIGLALRLATTPCGPLYSRNVSPDRELAAYLRTVMP
jgi:hypothetical protein